jgi:hypothetical protein
VGVVAVVVEEVEVEAVSAAAETATEPPAAVDEEEVKDDATTAAGEAELRSLPLEKKEAENEETLGSAAASRFPFPIPSPSSSLLSPPSSASFSSLSSPSATILFMFSVVTSDCMRLVSVIRRLQSSCFCKNGASPFFMFFNSCFLSFNVFSKTFLRYSFSSNKLSNKPNVSSTSLRHCSSPSLCFVTTSFILANSSTTRAA